MYKTWLTLIALCMIATTASTQTLFTYGKHTVTAPEFLRAYNKNNVPTTGDRTKAMKDYLELYINSRLKIREAYERGFDTMPQIRNEVENLRNQIIESYMSDPETMSRLVKEAFERSKKDIHVGHIFISQGNADTLPAYNRAQEVIARLKKGEDFSKLAVELSQDPSARLNKGDIGWITVFTLPYDFENSIYSLQPGKFSAPVRSRAGYHIFRNMGERKAVGKMKAKHILLAFPPDTDEQGKKQFAKKADSIYKRVLAGDDFGKLASALSNDYITAVNAGTMPDFGVGQFDAEFENRVWALTKDGAVTKPFQTSHGYHIVKRMGIVPVILDPANKLNEQELRQKINLDQRWKASRDVLYNRVIRQAGLKRGNYSQAALWDYTDSLLDKKPLGKGKDISSETVLFTLADTSHLTVDDWVVYAQGFRFKTDGTGRKPYEEVMEDYIHQSVMRFYRDNLETFNDDFKFQMSEFRDGNLFFEIMQQQIWNRAHSDSAELQALYQTNKKKYVWSKSADAVIFFCSDAQAAKTLSDQLKKNPLKWREYTDALAEKVVADSSRYEWTQIPDKNKAVPVNGRITTPVINPADNSASFAYIIKTYPTAMPRSFNDARGLVINDYQALLEEQWLKQLKQKYPVSIDWKVFESIAK